MIKREIILAIVHGFYEKATVDFLIGYHFRGIEDFDSHIPRIATFWELQLNGKTEHKHELPFNLLKVHEPLGIKNGELGRWMVLFRENLDQFTREGSIDKAQADKWMDKASFFEKRLRERLIRPS